MSHLILSFMSTEPLFLTKYSGLYQGVEPVLFPSVSTDIQEGRWEKRKEKKNTLTLGMSDHVAALKH